MLVMMMDGEKNGGEQKQKGARGRLRLFYKKLKCTKIINFARNFS